MASRASHKYSRQVSVIGDKIASLHVLLLGLDGAGAEIAKNLVLMGVRSIVLWDPAAKEPPRPSDADYNFTLAEYLDAADGTASTTSSQDIQVDALKQLNPDVLVMGNTDAAPPIAALGAHTSEGRVVCVLSSARFGPEALEKWNAHCRRLGVPMVFGCQVGISGVVACDFGETFTVTDVSTEPPASFITTSIMVEEANREELRVSVLFSPVEGFTRTAVVSDAVCFQGLPSEQQQRESGGNDHVHCQLNLVRVLSSEPHWKLAISNPGSASFRVPVASATGQELYTAYRGLCQLNGSETAVVRHLPSILLKEVHLPRTVSSRPILKQLTAVDTVQKRGDAHQCVLSALYRRKGLTAEEISTLDPNASADGSGQGTDEDIAWSVRFQPLCATIGGIAAQEAVKAIGRHEPLAVPLGIHAQGLCLTVPEGARLSARYDHMRAIVGEAGLEALRQARVFVVGCGAVGCEHLKNLTLMGVGHIAATDADSIDLSNVTRQFLFRESSDIGRPKSQVACDRVRRFDSSVEVDAFDAFVKDEGAELPPFDRAFWEQLSVVMGAVDNVSARLTIDAKCFEYGKPFIECGTSGLECAFYPAIPGVTSSYRGWRLPPNTPFAPAVLRALVADAAARNSIPICTNKLFPHAPEHCGAWALEQFRSCFELTQEEERKRILQVANAPNPHRAALRYAIENLRLWFDTKIADLVKQYPPDHKDGTFWQGSKRLPRLLDTSTALTNVGSESGDVELQSLVVSFLASFAFVALAAANKRVPAPFGAADITRLLSEGEDDDGTVVIAEDAADVVPQVFEKDDDANQHVMAVAACANLRAWNYHLRLLTFNEAKVLTGRITPALATTTSAVCGMACIEAVKVLIGVRHPLRASWYLNRSDPRMYSMLTPPGPWSIAPSNPANIPATGRVVCRWTDDEPLRRIRVHSAMTLRELATAIEEHVVHLCDVVATDVLSSPELDSITMPRSFPLLDVKLWGSFSAPLDEPLHSTALVIERFTQLVDPLPASIKVFCELTEYVDRYDEDGEPVLRNVIAPMIYLDFLV